MAKPIIFLIFIIFVSDAFTINLKSKLNTKTSTYASLHDPRNGCTISLRKTKDDKLQAISFISEMQSSLGHYSKCKLYFFINL